MLKLMLMLMNDTDALTDITQLLLQPPVQSLPGTFPRVIVQARAEAGGDPLDAIFWLQRGETA